MMQWVDAMSYCSFGLKVFPLMANKKTPAISAQDGGKGCHDATDDEDILASWIERFPQANIGVACGEISNIVVIDVDVKKDAGGEETIEQLEAEGCFFPPTVEVLTPTGGRHLYYRYHETVAKNSASKIGKGIDIRSNGGYVVAPPSAIDRKPYVWKTPLSAGIKRLPMWLSVKLSPTPEPQKMPFNPQESDCEALLKFVATSGKGERNNRLYWAACKMVESGNVDQQGLLSAASHCGLPAVEARKTIASAIRKVGAHG